MRGRHLAQIIWRPAVSNQEALATQHDVRHVEFAIVFAAESAANSVTDGVSLVVHKNKKTDDIKCAC